MDNEFPRELVILHILVDGAQYQCIFEGISLFLTRLQLHGVILIILLIHIFFLLVEELFKVTLRENFARIFGNFRLIRL